MQQEHLFEFSALSSQGVPPLITNGISNNSHLLVIRLAWLQQHQDVGSSDAFGAPLVHLWTTTIHEDAFGAAGGIGSIDERQHAISGAKQAEQKAYGA